jgi:hypothetical protein
MLDSRVEMNDEAYSYFKGGRAWIPRKFMGLGCGEAEWERPELGEEVDLGLRARLVGVVGL